MKSIVNFRAKTIVSATFCGFFLIANAVLAQPTSESRAGLPASYQGPASAVAAIVNETVITTYDLQQRVRLMILSSGGSVRPEMLPQLQAQALRSLIEEQLKLQEAKHYELEVSEKEVDEQLRAMAAQSDMTVETLMSSLQENGVSAATLRQQIAASIAWPRLVQGRYRDRVRINDSEIEDTIERMREDATKEQYLVSEICIPVSDPAQAQTYYDGSLQLLEQMRRGVPFTVVARQFSACPSAATGGDLGWLHAGELPPELDNALRALPPGSVTNPIPSEGALMILAIRDKRAAVVAGEQSWTLAYASAPVSIGRNEAMRALEKLSTADACGGRALRLDMGPNIGVALIENAKLSDIDPRFHSAVEDLSRGDQSAIVEVDNAFHTVLVCDKDEGLGIPSRDAIEDRIFGRKLNQIAQQYLRDIERKTMVDFRLKQQSSPNL